MIIEWGRQRCIRPQHKILRPGDKLKHTGVVYLYPEIPPQDDELITFCKKHGLLGFERMPTVNGVTFFFERTPSMNCMADLIAMGILEAAEIGHSPNVTPECKELCTGKLLCVWAPFTIEKWRQAVGLAAELGPGKHHRMGSSESRRVLPNQQPNERLALPESTTQQTVEEAPGRVHPAPSLPSSGGGSRGRIVDNGSGTRDTDPPATDTQ